MGYCHVITYVTLGRIGVPSFRDCCVATAKQKCVGTEGESNIERFHLSSAGQRNSSSSDTLWFFQMNSNNLWFFNILQIVVESRFKHFQRNQKGTFLIAPF